MVRIWVASLHQKIQCRDTLDFCFTQNLKFRFQGWIRTASTRRIVRRGKKPLRGFFRCAACEEPAPTKKSSVEIRWTFFTQNLKFCLQGWIRTASTRRIVRQAKGPAQKLRQAFSVLPNFLDHRFLRRWGQRGTFQNELFCPFPRQALAHLACVIGREGMLTVMLCIPVAECLGQFRICGV